MIKTNFIKLNRHYSKVIYEHEYTKTSYDNFYDVSLNHEHNFLLSFNLKKQSEYLSLFKKYVSEKYQNDFNKTLKNFMQETNMFLYNDMQYFCILYNDVYDEINDDILKYCYCMISEPEIYDFNDFYLDDLKKDIVYYIEKNNNIESYRLWKINNIFLNHINTMSINLRHKLKYIFKYYSKTDYKITPDLSDLKIIERKTYNIDRPNYVKIYKPVYLSILDITDKDINDFINDFNNSTDLYNFENRHLSYLKIHNKSSIYNDLYYHLYRYNLKENNNISEVYDCLLMQNNVVDVSELYSNDILSDDNKINEIKNNIIIHYIADKLRYIGYMLNNPQILYY